MYEEWKNIKGFEGFYMISNHGNVKSLERMIGVRNRTYEQRIEKEKIIKPWIDGKGYLRVALCKEGKIIKKLVHRLVAENFILNPLNKDQINHINGIKTDNNIVNLEWCTQSENIQHAVKTGLKIAKKGKDSSCSIPVLMIEPKTNVVLKEFPSMKDAYLFFNKKGSPAAVCDCCKNKKRTAFGYKWQYANK